MLVVSKLDRLARSVRDFSNMIADLEAAGVALVSVNESFDGTTPLGKMAAQLLSVFAEVESSQNSLRQKVAYRLRRDRGDTFPNRPPFGFVRDEIKKVVVDHERMKIVKRIFAMRRSNKTYREIAAGLTADGIPAPCGRGKVWNAGTVQLILHRQKLYGERRVK